MAYIPTTWNTGDTITAAAMNKIENGIANAGGVATVKIVWGSNGESSISFTGATNGIASGRPYYSLIGGGFEHISYGYHPINYLTVPILTDGNQAVVFFNDYFNTNYDITSVGKTLLEFHEQTAASDWSSAPLYGFIIEGDTTITVTPK